MIIAYAFIQHAKLGMMYTDDARIASSNITHHHDPRAWETSGREQLAGKTGHTRKPQAREGPHYETKKLNTRAKGQRGSTWTI